MTDDPRCIPIELDGPVPEGQRIPYPEYTDEDHETWSILFERQRRNLVNVACAEYLEGLQRMDFTPLRIPALADASRILSDTVGWNLARVPGLLHERDFFAFLARRVFPCTDYIRPRHEIDYTPAPDLFHDLFGHTPMIPNPAFAEFYERFGQAALVARGADRRRLERFYWFTVEFGLIDTADGIRVYGNGILSSFAEARHALTAEVEKLAFDAERIAEQEYDVWHLQPRLYVIESFDELVSGFVDWARRRGWS